MFSSGSTYRSAKTAVRVVDHDGVVQWQGKFRASPAR